MEQEKYIAESLARDILEVAKGAKSEEELRIGVEKLLEPALKELGIEFTPQYGRTIIRGKPDAVYGHVTIEYEKPGKLGTTGGLTETTSQLARYLSEAATQYGGKKEDALRKMIGVSLDGFQILFLRHKGAKIGAGVLSLKAEFKVGDFQVFGPFPVTKESTSLFLLYLHSLSRKLLTPEGLADEFGPKGSIARKLVNAFYDKLKDTTNPKTQTFFSEWERIFGIVYGRDVAKEKTEILDLARLYGCEEAVELKSLLFAVHTYYGLLMKLLAIELASLQSGSLISSFVGELSALSEKGLKDKLVELEEGGLFYQLGIKNFLEGDFFRWYLSGWDEGLADGVREMASSLSQFEPATTTLEPEATRDLLKKLYQYLLPKKLRHDLGEYYTPDWLAERLLNQVGYNGNPEHRLIDPGCGSGTFLILAIKRVREFAERRLLEPKKIIEAILKNIVGFDLNPLAVIAARTNYLLALGDLIRYFRPLEIPVYMCDSILTPSEYVERIAGGLFPDTNKGYKLSTGVGDFYIPQEVIDKERMEVLTPLLEECVRAAYSEEEFLERTERSLNIERDETKQQLTELYSKILMLEREGRNGLWIRFLKNAFAPIFVGKFDFVVGNPPWVNWESLADGYRDATKKLWEVYGLFSLKGHAARLGGGKKDISMLFTYASMDNYLKHKGRLGFVITQTLFKTKGAGDGFRRFKLGDKEDLRIVHVDDLVELQPFEGATNRTSVVVLQKGASTKYPTPYTLWRKKKGARIALDLTLKEVENLTKRSHLYAKPINDKEITSPWITARKRASAALSKIIGKSYYKARAGATTCGADGVYLVQVLTELPDRKLLIKNLHQVGKKKIKMVEVAIEPDLVFPAVRGKDADRWRSILPTYVLMTQDPQKRIGYNESWMKTHLPKTYLYLLHFKDNLLSRKSKILSKDPFYSLYGVNSDTFAPYKVIWGRVANEVKACVVSLKDDKYLGKKPLVPFEAMMIPFSDGDESFYVCALINSSPARLTIRAYIVLHPDTHVLDNIQIPKYEDQNSLHRELCQLSQKAHELAAKGEEAKAELQMVEEEIDQKAAELWGITEEELDDIKSSLKELS